MDSKGRGIGLRLVLTSLVVAWLFILSEFWEFVTQVLSYDLGWRYKGSSGGGFGRDFAFPFIGGMPNFVPNPHPATWYTNAVWILLFLWPLAIGVYVWVRKDLDKIKWTFVLSCIGYGIFFFALLFFVATGLYAPLCYF